MKAELKRLRQQIARTSNEIYQRTQERKATAKEKELLNELKKLMGGVDQTTRKLKEYQENWIDKLRFKKIKLLKLIERGRQIIDNANFERDQKNLGLHLESMPGIYGIQNFWWKRLKPARRKLKRLCERFKDNNDLIRVWWSSGRTMLLPKTKGLTDEKNYCLITCLNTSYKLLTGLVGKYMRGHTTENDI